MANIYRYRSGPVDVDVVRKGITIAFDVGDFVVFDDTTKQAVNMSNANENLQFLGICTNYAATADTKVTFHRANGAAVYEYPFRAAVRAVHYAQGVTFAKKQVLSANHASGTAMTDSIAVVVDLRSADTVVSVKNVGGGTGTMANPVPNDDGCLVRFKATVAHCIGDRS